MNIRILAAGLTAAVAVFCSVPTEAAFITGSGFNNNGSTTNQIIQGITFTSVGGAFQQKNINGFIGVGVSGLTAGEIDIGQSITGTVPAASSFNIGSITIGFLFDGPEFSDVNEVAQITVNGNAFTLTATGATTAILSNGPAGAVVTNLSPATATGAAVWLLSNLNFINVQTVSFTPLKGNPGPGGCPGGCTNQSDFSLVQLDTNVPEPTTLGLIGLGLLGVGAMARRRRNGDAKNLATARV